jgi:Mor family transcriptional regulator
METIKNIVIDNSTPDDNGCWIWNGYVRGNYPAISIKKKFYIVHRLSYEAWYGVIEDGLIVRHKCDVPRCVNPAHLEVGTYKDNSADIIKRGRRNDRYGEENGASKLTNIERDDIVYRSKQGEKHKDIASLYGVSRTCISRICRMGGHSKKPRKLSEKEKQDLLDFHEKGESRDNLAKRYGIAKSTVGYYVWKRNKK